MPPYTPREVQLAREKHFASVFETLVKDINIKLITTDAQNSGAIHIWLNQTNYFSKLIEHFASVGWLVSIKNASPNTLVFRFPETSHSEGPYR